MEYTVVAIFRGTEILMQYKLRGPFPNKWNLPGGKLQEDESPIDCAIREVSEETGIDIYASDTRNILYNKFWNGVELYLFVTTVPLHIGFTSMEDEPLAWVEIDSVINNKLPTVDNLSVPFFVKLAMNYIRG